MYQRESNSGETVVWDPDNKDLAKTAIQDTQNTGVGNNQNLPEQGYVALQERADNRAEQAQIARNIRERYRELASQSSP